MSKNIVSYSLWGSDMIYWVGALKNIELVNKFYPGFISRFYIDKNSKKDLIESIKGENVEIVLVNSEDSFHGMFWRFWASEDPEVDIFLSRDCDSRISEREVAAVNEWLNSDKDFHIMRDHPYHQSRIMGGMWGSRNQLMRRLELSEKIKDWLSKPKTDYILGIDQDFLNEIIYQIVKSVSLEHSEFGIKFSNPVETFPTERNNYEFVGDSFDETDNRNQNYWKIIEKITTHYQKNL